MASTSEANSLGSQVTDPHHQPSIPLNNETTKVMEAKEDTLVGNPEETPQKKKEKTPTERKGEPFNYDDIMELHIGQLGKFQLRSFLWLCLPALFPGLIVMSYSFTGGVPDYR